MKGPQHYIKHLKITFLVLLWYNSNVSFPILGYRYLNRAKISRAIAGGPRPPRLPSKYAHAPTLFYDFAFLFTMSIVQCLRLSRCFRCFREARVSIYCLSVPTQLQLLMVMYFYITVCVQILEPFIKVALYRISLHMYGCLNSLQNLHFNVSAYE